MDLDCKKKLSKEYYELYYDAEYPLPPIDLEQRRRERLQPCYTTGVDHKTDNKMAFHELILRTGGWEDKSVLDYACGDGSWAAHFALTGARKVVGFDLAESGIRRAHDRIVVEDLANKVYLMVMDAKDLAFPANTFEMVFGDGVLPHVIKCSGVFEELHRVMKPGAKAYFKEGLADFPLFSLYWKLKGETQEGVGPIHAKQIRKLTPMFSDVQIIGDTFFFSVKTFVWKPSAGKIRRRFLRVCKDLDNFLFTICPPLRTWGSFAYIVLTK